jgi:PAS domain S-box-containing protein
MGRSAAAAALVLVLLGLGLANIVERLRVHRVEDGVLWGQRPEGVTAVEVAPDAPAARAGLEPGDILLAIDGDPVGTTAQALEPQHWGHQGTRLTYTILRLGSQESVEVTLAPSGPHGPLYFVLAAVGLFTLLVGAVVRLRRSHDEATLHFFWLCVAFFGTFTFSFSGEFSRLDWVFYWGDVVAMALLPPLLLHFTLVFPERQVGRGARLSWLLPALYVPSVVLVVARILILSRHSIDPARAAALVGQLDRTEPLALFAASLAAVAVVVRAFGRITSSTGRRQLRWIATGTLAGVSPFAFGYALPWALGIDPPVLLQLTAVPLGLVPLAFASAIVRYRLRDVEIIVKRGLAFAAFLTATALLCLALLRLVTFIFGDEADPHNLTVAVLATLVVVLLAQPVKHAVQASLDRMFYRDRYDYRRALVGFARDLNTDLDVLSLSRRLVTRIVETLVVDRMALLLADDRRGDFRVIEAFGCTEPLRALERASSFMERLNGGRTVALDDPIAAARFSAEEVEAWRDQGIYYFVPCTFEGAAIAVLALGRKEGDEPFNSEDLALLTAVAGQVATALENARLYRQLQVKADELGRMREFNDNILESLDDGLVVFDAGERIIRWNRALEMFYGVERGEAVGRRLSEVFDARFVGALRAALAERPEGAALFKVPLPAHRLAADPGPLLVNVTAVPLQNGAGAEAAGTILLIEDVTDRVRLEEHLQISEKMASIGLLAAGVAHEVNTPLTGISSFTQMLLENADPADPRTALLEKIERQTFRAAKIVNGLLTLSRPGTPGGEHAAVDLNAVITDVCSLLEHQLSVGRIRVRRELAPSLAPVSGIEHQLQQVFLNLFLNARDAMPSGGWLTVTTRLEGGEVVAEVADTGSGIPPEQMARIYDPFFTTKAIGRGTGLGLSITYGIVRDHGGAIRCDSTPGQGTRFSVSLPQAAPAARSAAH